MKTLLMSLLCAATLLSAEVKVLALSGSLRNGSHNKKLLMEAVQIAKEMGASVEILDAKELKMPFFDQDAEVSEGMPKKAKILRDRMLASDGILIASPEYNGSVSGVLKNALDWASRSEEGGPSAAAFKGKHFAIMSASPGKMGGRTGLNHLRTILERLGGKVTEAQVSIPNAPAFFEGKEKDLSSLNEEIGRFLSEMKK